MRKKIARITFLSSILWILSPFIYLYFTHPPKAKLDYERHPPHTNATMNYFICGLLAQPRPAFAFANDIVKNQGVAYLPYLQTGTDLTVMANLIIKDIELNHYQKICIWTISVGDVVATQIENYFLNVENPPTLIFVKANPCSEPIFVSKPLNTFLKPISIGLYGARCMAGPLGFIPWIKSYKESYSLILGSEITRFIAFDDNVTPVKESPFPRCIILSSEDELLDNTTIANSYITDSLYLISTPHGATEAYASEYHNVVVHFFSQIAAP